VIRLFVVVEGATEDRFVNGMIVAHLAAFQVYASAVTVGKAIAQRRGHRQRGGGHYRHWQRDIRTLLRSNPGDDVRVTTLFDLYGLSDDFPPPAEDAPLGTTGLRKAALEAALARDIDDPRFIPNLQRHEFEALVLASLPQLRALLDASDAEAVDRLAAALGQLAPEDVNDGATTAPSKRLACHVPHFSKLVHGLLAVEGAGLDHLRRQCPGFGGWLDRLEALGRTAA